MGVDIFSLYVTRAASAIDVGSQNIVEAFHWTPTTIVALMMLALQDHDWGAAWILVAWLVLVVGFVALIVYLLSFMFLPLWQGIQEGSFEARTSIAVAHHAPARAFPRLLKSDLGALFEKEIIVNFRSVRDSLWVVFILGLWVLQSALNLYLKKNSAYYGDSEMNIIGLVETLQVATAVFFTSTFALRFALPSFSSDRRMAWIIGTAPIAPRRIYFSKLWFYAVTFLLLGISLGIVNASLLGISLTAEGSFLALIAVMIVAITTFALSVGALFPDTESDDPEIISTSLAGLGFTFSSLAYGAVGSWLYYHFLITSSAAGIYCFIAGSIALILLMIIGTSIRLKTFNPFSDEVRAGA
jgi:hypothetical protein